MKKTRSYAAGKLVHVRWMLINTKSFSLYINHFVGMDTYDKHDHIWDFVSIMVWGKYAEQRVDGPHLRRAFSIEYVPAEMLHAVHARNAWTIQICGRRRREWGFSTEQGWMHHLDYFKWRKQRKDARADLAPPCAGGDCNYRGTIEREDGALVCEGHIGEATLSAVGVRESEAG